MDVNVSCQPEQVAENIYRIRIPLPENPLRELCSYLIMGDDRNLLVDTGFRLKECEIALRDGLNALDVDLSRTDIFLTHMHSDHSGLAPDIIENGCKIYISDVDKPWLEGHMARPENWSHVIVTLTEGGIPQYIMDQMYKKSPAIVYAAKPGSARYTGVKDGDELVVGKYRFKCILTPGHTPGHMCLWEETHKILILGDHVLFNITPNITTWPNAKDSLGDYFDSLKKIEKLDVKIALPAHREIGEFHERIPELLKHHEGRLNECRQALHMHPDINAYEVASHMTWSIRRKSWEEFPPAQLFFAIGECQAHLTYLVYKGEVVTRKGDNGMVFYSLKTKNEG